MTLLRSWVVLGVRLYKHVAPTELDRRVVLSENCIYPNGFRGIIRLYFLTTPVVMDQARDERIMRLVHSCSDMAVDERERYLSQECAEDGDLRSTVESILSEDMGRTGSFVAARGLDKSLPDHYRSLKLIGTGGMAEVFLAEDTRLGRHVAIKFLNKTLHGDADLISRFNLEARAISALNHPNIVTIYDIGESDGIQFIVSEYIEGESLRARLGRGPLSVYECVDIGISIASALSSAHRAGIIHRDLKPDNVMLRTDGTVKVVDFGLAKASGPAISGGENGEAKTLQAVVTSPEIIVGTPGYMSPEQCRGQDLDGRSDIFSLGVILFEMITRHLPFTGETSIDIIAKIISGEPRRIEKYELGTPPSLVAVIDKALAKKPAQRYSSMDALLEDLDAIKDDLTGGRATSAVRTVVTVAQERRRRFAYLAAGVGVLVMLFGGAWIAFRGRGGGVTVAPMRSVPITSWDSYSVEALSTASFSPDSRMIAYTSKKTGSSEIWVKPSIGGEPIQVTKSGSESRYPVWSPDGQQVAFFSQRPGSTGIWRASFTGGPESQMAAVTSPLARPLRWSNDGKLYLQDGSELYSVDTRSGAKEQLTDFTSSGLRPRTIAISSDASTLAISVEDGSLWKIKTKRLNAGSFVDIASSEGQVDGIAFTPDGRSVIYTGVKSGSTQLFKATVDGGSQTQITTGETDYNVQDVSADGAKVLYSAVNETSDIWSLDTQDGKQAVIANDVSEELWPDVSPDGQSVAYQSMTHPDKPFRSTILAVGQHSKSAPIPVSPDGFLPVWSPDSRRIAFLRRNDVGTMSLWVVRLAGAEAAKLGDGLNLGYVGTPYLKKETNHIAWSPDSSAIMFAAKTDFWNLWLAQVDGSGRRTLTTNADVKVSYCCASWLRDGSLAAFKSDDLGSKVYRLLVKDIASDQGQVVFESNSDFRYLGPAANGTDLVIAQRADPADQSQTPATTNIYVIATQNGAPRKVASLSNAYFQNIHLAPNRQTIAFVSRANNLSELWTVPILGGNARRLLSDQDPKIMISSIAWSSDSRSIVFGKQTRTNLLSMLTTE